MKQDDEEEFYNAYGNNIHTSCKETPVNPPPYDVVVASDVECEGKAERKDEHDPWALIDREDIDSGKPWKEMTGREKTGRVLINICKVILVLGNLYLFICSIDLLGASFQLVGGRTAGEAFSRSELLNNPICGLMIGVFVTVLLQSSSTSTSIVVTMVAAQIIPVRQGIYIIMGANIGTSVTNTIVAMGQIADKEQFRKAFAGATVHDMFNWLAVLVLLPIEAASGFLYYSTREIVNTIDVSQSSSDEPQFLKVITKPLVDAIVKVDKNVIYGIAKEALIQKRPLTRYFCSEEKMENCTNYSEENYSALKEDRTHPNYWASDGMHVNGTMCWKIPIFNESKACTHLFIGAGLPSEYEVPEGWPSKNLSDAAVGGILVVISLIVLCTCLVILVKILQSLLKGVVLKIVRTVINANITVPKSCAGSKYWNIVGKELTGYIAMLVGAGLTMLVQSSSVFTSAVTPLVGLGIITVDRMYPLTLGANIGTTVTGLLAAFTSDPETIRDAVQVSLAHTLFNITGILIFYPIPLMRRLPIFLAKSLGNTTAEYRWFAISYLIVVFCVAPAAVFALSIPGWYVLAAVLIPLALLAIFVITVNIIQSKRPNCLPHKLRSWDWCPRFLCSLEPYDRCFRKMCPCCKICQDAEKSMETGSSEDPIKAEYQNGDLRAADSEKTASNGMENKGFVGEVVQPESIQTQF